MVIWEIKLDATNRLTFISGSSHAQVVECLIGKGFKRILEDNVPYQDEPLFFECEDGRRYDAMAVYFLNVEDLPNFKDDWKREIYNYER